MSVSPRRSQARGVADGAIHCTNLIRVENFGNGFVGIPGLSCDVLRSFSDRFDLGSLALNALCRWAGAMAPALEQQSKSEVLLIG